jgi:hypothetical protein
MRIGTKTSAATSKPIDSAANASRSTVEDKGIDHGRFDIIIPQEFLHRSYIVPAFEQVRREGISEGYFPRVRGEILVLHERPLIGT